jgi:hypothetical protein
MDLKQYYEMTAINKALQYSKNRGLAVTKREGDVV